MDSEKYILALDQGTTSSRAIIVNRQGQVVASSQRGFEQIFPRPGWVEHDASEIWYTQSSVAAEAVAKANLTGLDIACIGITNQRETTVIWDRETSLPVYNAIVWQDRRTAAYCEELKGKGYEQAIHQKTGLILDAYFSATKIKWILDNIEGVRERAEKGKLCFGTIDSWLVWRFTRGGAHVTDVSNASRTMLFNIHTQQWDDDLLDLFGIPRAILPEVKASSEVYCDTATTLFSTKIPISGIAGDQQAALFGQLCVEQGMSKTTYGTGCFVMMNTGDRAGFFQKRDADYDRMEDRGANNLCARGERLRRRSRDSMAARRLGNRPLGARDRRVGAVGRRQRRSLFRSGPDGPGRALLGSVRAGTSGRSDPRNDRGPI